LGVNVKPPSPRPSAANDDGRQPRSAEPPTLDQITERIRDWRDVFEE
jgi:hypothetical protein